MSLVVVEGCVNELGCCVEVAGLGSCCCCLLGGVDDEGLC